MTDAQILPRHVCQEMRGQVSFLEEQFERYEKEARETLRQGWTEAKDKGEKYPARWLNCRERAFIVKVAGFEDIFHAAAWLERGCSS